MHIIRLRKPWTRTSPQGTEERVDVPDLGAADLDASDLKDHSTAAEVRYTRNFNSPTGIEDQTRIYLRIQCWEGELTRVELNGNVVAMEKFEIPLELDITADVSLSNRLDVTLLSLPDMPARLTGEVALLIIES